MQYANNSRFFLTLRSANIKQQLYNRAPSFTWLERNVMSTKIGRKNYQRWMLNWPQTLTTGSPDRPKCIVHLTDM